MASTFRPSIQTFYAGAAIAKGTALKFGANDMNVVQATAAADSMIGIAQGDAATGDKVEVALPGGGAKALAGAAVAPGERLTADADGKLIPATGADVVIATAMQTAVLNDIFYAFVK